MSGFNIGKAPNNNAVLPFYGTAAFFFMVLSVLLFFSAEKLNVHYFSPHMLSIVHLAALGWGTMVIFGAAYQLLPVICERDLFSSQLAFISYCFLSSGVVCLCLSFWFFQLGWFMIAGGSLILIAASIYFLNVLKTTNIWHEFSLQKLFIISSSTWFLFTIVVGLLLAINLSYPFFTKNHLEILKLHAHAGLAGWFLQLISGISFKLIPMFLLGKSQKEYLIKWSFFFQNIGLLLFLTDAYFFGISDRSLLYAGFVGIGILAWLLYLQNVYKNRIKKKIDVSMKHTFVALSCLVLGFLFIPVIYFAVDTKWAFVYGLFLFLGWISSIILGMTFKTLPFIIWNDKYKNLNGKMKIPLPKHLYSEKLLTYQFWIFLSALYTMALSLIFQQPFFLKIGLTLWVIVAVLYSVNVGKILTHKTKILDGTINR